ncbi:MAG TPA: hypothetical protein VLX11_15390 [Candidatus Acidoferrales bacterium]|nr:hypothetical protein [Candidatus Acidoferrales bacterium]
MIVAAQSCDWLIGGGQCFALFAYDAARSIKLEQAERRVHEATQRQTIPHKRRAPSYFEYQPPPLRVSVQSKPINIGRFSTRPDVDLLIYDFGAVAVIYSFPIAGHFADLLPLSEELYDNESLLSDSRLRVSELVKVIGDAALHASFAPVVEDYVIFHIESFGKPFDAKQFCSANSLLIAQILRAERQTLSAEEVEDALAAKISFGTEDLTMVDWNAALILDREGEDVRAVLGFANVELLEMRYLDQKLDRALDRIYDTLLRPSLNLLRIFGYYSAASRSIAQLQIDSAILYEGVNNTLKLLGDQYLARVYRLVNKRFHLDEWDTSIIRKLQTLESIYEKTSNQATNRRMEVLEWVIIILIAVSVALELIHSAPK